MKIKFESDDDLPLNKQLKFPAMAIIVRSVFEKVDKFYQQIYSDECLYELWNMQDSTKKWALKIVHITF